MGVNRYVPADNVVGRGLATMALIVFIIVFTAIALAAVVGLGADSRDGGRWYPGMDDFELRRR
jgi:hypothetical protein